MAFSPWNLKWTRVLTFVFLMKPPKQLREHHLDLGIHFLEACVVEILFTAQLENNHCTMAIQEYSYSCLITSVICTLQRQWSFIFEGQLLNQDIIPVPSIYMIESLRATHNWNLNHKELFSWKMAQIAIACTYHPKDNFISDTICCSVLLTHYPVHPVKLTRVISHSVNSASLRQQWHASRVSKLILVLVVFKIRQFWNKNRRSPYLPKLGSINRGTN